MDPDRTDEDTDVALALRLTYAAIELVPGNAEVLNTHAWALFANGHLDESLAASREALDLAAEDEKEEYQNYFDRLQAAIDAAKFEAAPAPTEDD